MPIWGILAPGQSASPGRPSCFRAFCSATPGKARCYSPADNIFYRLCPNFLLLPLVILATLATIIASQSIITGAFSMTRQAIRLGWLPPLRIKQTSEEGYGQIYVGAVNWMLMVVTLGLTVGFGKSDNLAAAYGIAVSLTMLITSALLFIAMCEIWGWSVLLAGVVAGAFVVVDASFFAANTIKLAEGGYVPLVLAAAVYGLMYVWHLGAAAVFNRLQQQAVPVDAFMTQITQQRIPRVPGTAVFLTRTQHDAPPVMVWHLKHNRALHERLFVLTIITESVPWLRSAERLSIQELAPNFWRAAAHFGFMERPDIPALLRHACDLGCTIDLSDITYYVGHETITPGEDERALPRWVEALFALMQRNASHLTDYFRLPADSVVEIGRQVAI
jgi:KUP system potassium uptake protein